NISSSVPAILSSCQPHIRPSLIEFGERWAWKVTGIVDCILTLGHPARNIEPETKVFRSNTAGSAKSRQPLKSGASQQIAEKLKFRIRASLQRCRKFFELRCPFRGCAPKTEFFSNLLRNKAVLQDSQSNLRSAALHKGKEFLPTEGSKYRPDRRRARPPQRPTVTTPAPCRNDLRCLEHLLPEPCPAKPRRHRNY